MTVEIEVCEAKALKCWSINLSFELKETSLFIESFIVFDYVPNILIERLAS